MSSTIIDRNGGTSSSSPTTDRNTGLSSSAAVKGPCVVCAASNTTLRGLQTIDGVTVVVDDRVLVTGQTDTTLNGIYIVSTGNWQRSPDFNRNDDVRHGTQVRVTSGSVYSGIWVLASSDPVSMGTTAITWSRDTSLANGALLAVNNLSDLVSAIAAVDMLIKSVSATAVAANAGTLDVSASTDFLVGVMPGDFSAITLGNNKVRFLRFQGVCVITFGASLAGNTAGATFTTATGDTALLSVSSAGVKRLIIWPKSGAPMQLLDSVFRIIDNSDQTKQWAVELAGLTSGQTRTWTIPDANMTPAALDVANQIVTGGARVTSNAAGTISSGTVTLDPGTRPMWDYTNNGAHTLAPGSNKGSIVLDITNGASAGAITTSGWTKVVGAFDTTNAHAFRCWATIGVAGSLLTIQPLF